VVWRSVFLFVSLGWLLFKLTKLDHVWAYFDTIARHWDMSNDPYFLAQVGIYTAPVALYHIWHLGGHQLPRSVVRILRPLALGVMLTGILLNSGSQGRFIYFQF
jgi:alginate O-acetyltransferase complex protein AlgI